MVKSVKELDVYQRAYKTALDIHKQTKTFPKGEQFALTSQIRRCSKSICANLAEGFAKSNKSSNEFKRFASIAVGSSEETKVWLDFAQDLGYISQQQHKELVDDYNIISKQIYTMIERWK